MIKKKLLSAAVIVLSIGSIFNANAGPFDRYTYSYTCLANEPIIITIFDGKTTSYAELMALKSDCEARDGILLHTTLERPRSSCCYNTSENVRFQTLELSQKIG